MLPSLLLAAALACPPMTPQSVTVVYFNPPHDCTPIATRCRPNEPMTFRAAGNYNFACGSHAFSWKFSDGAIMSGQQVVKTFEEWGVHQVELTIAGPQQSMTLTRVIAMGVTPFDAAASPLGGRVVEFRAIPYADANFGEWIWSFGDGTSVATRDDVVTHVYSAAGDYTATLSSSNAVALRAVTVTVESPKRRPSRK